jgi:hypothetical protein
MADIDQIIAGGAKTNADFNALPGIVQSYWAGLDQKQKQLERDVFKDGLPTNQDGSPNYGEAAKKLYQIGNIDKANALATIDLQRQQLQMGQQAAAAMGSIEGGSSASAPTLPPSTSRNGGAPVAPPIQQNAGPMAAKPSASPQGDQQGSIVGMVSAAGVPDELAGPIIAQVSAATKMDPNAAVNPQVAPRVQQIVAAAAQRMRQGNQAPPAPQPSQPQAAPNPQQNQGTFGAPSALPTRGAVPTGTDPEIQKQIATYTYIASNPAYPKSVQEAALSRLKALQEQGAPTGNMKEYDLYRRQGGNLPFNEWLADNEAQKTAATEDAKVNSKKYENLVENGTKAQMEIPQLEMLQQQMNDPNFFSGAGEKYNLLYKRLKSAVGIDPDAAVPQEYLRKATAANVLSSLGALKGLGQIRVSEINMAREAAASPENSIPANKLLVEISKRTHQRNAEIAELAQDYKQQHGTLDAGFDKKVTAYYKKNPLFTDAEIKDWHKAIGEQPKQGAPSNTSGPQKFASPADVHAAIADKRLQKGDKFVDANGVVRTVP